MKKNVVVFLLLATIFSCNNSTSTTDGSTIQNDTTKIFPLKPLVIPGDNGDDHGPADVRLSVVDVKENDSIVTYDVTSTFGAKKVGFLINVPKLKEGAEGFGSGIVLMSKGEESNNFLRLLDSIYGQKTDTLLQFTKAISVNFVNLKTMAKNRAGKDSEPYNANNEYKLFFEDEKNNAELYLNINQEEHWVELNEKDAEYRPLIIKFLKK